MNTTEILFLIGLFGSVAASATIGVMALRRARKLETGHWLGLMALSQAGWTALYIGEVVASSLEGKVLWDKLQWVPVVLTIISTWAFGLIFAGGRERRLRTAGRINFVFGVSFLTLAFTDPWHGLVYRNSRIVLQPFPALLYDFGPAALGGILWMYVLATWSMVALVRRYLATHAIYRRQIALVVLGMVFPYTGGFFTASGVSWDISPFTFAVCDLILGFALFNYGLLSTVPIARERVFEHIADGVVVEDPAGRIVDINPAAERLLGGATSGVLGTPLVELATKLGVCLPAASDEAEWEVGHGDQTHLVQVSTTVILGRRGQPAGRLLLVRDQTLLRQAHAEVERANRELERTNRELERTNRELATFNYSVSHDLQAPLRHMRSFATILAEDAGHELSPSAQRLLSRIQHAGASMAAMIEGMLRLARVGRQSIRREPLALGQIAGELVQRLREADPDRRLDVRIAAGLEATGDLALVTALLQNLLENAFKFTRGRDGVIEVGRELTGNGASFFVRDNGRGFDMRHANQLFKPFQRLHAETEVEGSGIGLSLVKQIVERHGGEVRATSAPGQGTTIYFTLDPRPAR